MKLSNKWLVRFLLLTGSAFAIIAFCQVWSANAAIMADGGAMSRRVLSLLILTGVVGICELILLSSTWTRRFDALVETSKGIFSKMPAWSKLSFFILTLTIAPLYIQQLAILETILGQGVRIWLLWILIRSGGLIWKSLHRSVNLLTALLGTGLLHGLLLQVLTYIPDLSSNPFTLEWSEGSRFYNASLFFSRMIYGIKLPLPVLHPTRYLLQSAAFLFPGLGEQLLFHRGWQVFLWLSCNGLAAWALVKRLKLTRGQDWLAASWVFLFFFQGPVYYHLVLCAATILFGFDRRHPMRSLLVVMLASIWAGLSRINWYPVPGVLAGMLYLLEEPRHQKPAWRYLLWPGLWVTVGLASALAANQIYKAISGNPEWAFGSALDSPLLWYRLLPNVTYAPGIIIGSLLLSLPVIILLGISGRKLRNQWDRMRVLGLGAILLIFYCASLVVSVKVGGGSNLHNFDNFILLLAVCAVYAWFERFSPEVEMQGKPKPAIGYLLLVVGLLPVLQPLLALNPPPTRQHTPTQETVFLSRIQTLLDSVKGEGPVLFISNRQLLTFKDLSVDQFEPEFENVFLMEMAMSGNSPYLEKFYDDLQNHRFPLIINYPINLFIQDRSYAFSEENNLWVRRVEGPILENYTLLAEYPEFGMSIYQP